jgi:hypothetical protein
MSYGPDNPYVLNIIPLFNTQGSASGGNTATDTAAILDTATKTLAINQINTFDSGTVQIGSDVLITINGIITNLNAKIAELEARIVALGG